MRREGWIKDKGNGRIEGGGRRGGVGEAGKRGSRHWRGEERDLRGEGRKGGRKAFEGVFDSAVKGSHQGL